MSNANLRRGNNARKGCLGFQPIPLEERIARRIRINGECHEWMGSRGHYGHGRIEVAGRNTAAHRVAYELARGPIPDGLVLDHLCRNPPCVNPDHLEPVTPRENVMRGSPSPITRNAAKTHCANGHEFSSDNTLTFGGQRNCRTCVRAAQRRYRQRKAAK